MTEEKRKWRLSYAPYTKEPVSDILFEGTKDELDGFFRDTVCCKSCREESLTGIVELVDWSTREVCDTIDHGGPVSPWSTGCGCEWDYEDVTDG